MIELKLCLLKFPFILADVPRIPVSFVQNVVIKVCKEGRPTRYLQKYLRVWEYNPQFAGNAHSIRFGTVLLWIIEDFTAIFTNFSHNSVTSMFSRTGLSAVSGICSVCIISIYRIRRDQPHSWREMRNFVGEGEGLKTCHISRKIHG